MPPFTNYVLHYLSTFPMIVPLHDYCRSYKIDEKIILDTWDSVIHAIEQDNEQIRVFYKPKEWVVE